MQRPEQMILLHSTLNNEVLKIECENVSLQVCICFWWMVRKLHKAFVNLEMEIQPRLTVPTAAMSHDFTEREV